ncbi:MAG: ATP-binding cassette domain-containing protein [Alphaproteobacteria bacterium]|nr:ATP-binding cassette domain-containing protein [Alphaproteobacteria bacterium]
MTGEPLLRADNLAIRFGGVAAVRGVSVVLAEGDLRCIIGPNGAGKSTLFNMIAGTLKPDSGTIDFEGRPIVGLPVHDFARIGIARKFQVPSLFASLTVRENLDVAARRRESALDRDARIERMLAELELAGLEEATAGELAHGQKQWLEIGMALMGGPKLLLLDEPTAGMGSEETQKTARLLLGMAGTLTIVVIEHDMHFVRALACPTMVLHQGQVIAAGAFADIERDELVRDVYLGRR